MFDKHWLVISSGKEHRYPVQETIVQYHLVIKPDKVDYWTGNYRSVSLIMIVNTLQNTAVS
jgi:hypothetical protein